LRLGHPRVRPARDLADLRNRLRACVARGQLELVGTFTQPDTNLPAGEALLRQGLMARTWYRSRLGAAPTVAWNLDSFGQSAQLPQILRQCGYDALLAFRVAPTEDPGVSAAPDGLGGSFLFRGLDGTELPTHALPEGYSPGVVRLPGALAWWSAGTRVVQAAQRLSDEAGALPVFLPFGTEFSPPLPGIDRLLRRLQAALPDREARLGTAREFFDELARRRDRLAVHEGDLNPVFPGTHALRPALKRADRVTTSTVLAAETLDGLLTAALRLPDAERSSAVARAWAPLLTNHAHDSIGGCHAAAVTGDVADRYRESSRLSRGALDRGLRSLSTGQPGDVVVFNPLGWARTDVVRLAWRGPRPAAVHGPDGEELPFAFSRSGDRAFLAVRVTLPAFGYAVLGTGGEGGDDPPEAPLDAITLGSGSTVARLRGSGQIELTSADHPVARLGRIRLEEDRGNAYLPSPGANLETFAGKPWWVTGDALGRRAVCNGWLGDDPLRLELREIPGRDWLGLSVEGPPIWAGRRIRLPIKRVTAGASPYEVPFGEMARLGPAAVQGYIRLAGAAGVANLGCPGHEIGPTTVDLILLRSIRLLSQRRPLLRLRIPIDATVDHPWRADLALAADARRAARELTRPLVGWQVRGEGPDSGGIAPSGSLMPPLDGPDTVEVVAVKAADVGGGLIVRLLQTGASAASVHYTPPGRGRVERTDAREGPGTTLRKRAGRVRVHLGPWELVTLRWVPA